MRVISGLCPGDEYFQFSLADTGVFLNLVHGLVALYMLCARPVRNQPLSVHLLRPAPVAIQAILISTCQTWSIRVFVFFQEQVQCQGQVPQRPYAQLQSEFPVDRCVMRLVQPGIA